jgi:hypothetical protein
MRAQRIKTGFHRIGVVLGLLSLIPAVVVFGYFAVMVAEGHGEYIHLAVGGAWVLLGAFLYGSARALGWIVAGFVGDDGQISN